ncbi:PREDICTED: juxtaposed with another zinc finger protein 1 [Nicrophorus vespilloides]|uniref:Juxtaposed with another zinc finger protein 1 n=1 Tax=Nicrophorus vespilloides TaxID=110193 RepID=A0ABM1M8D6_NICVS|nr:PREDICTED: juxtaposed with another zinc finger protein 1 [Nicrophorus vespilloides]
MAYFLRNNCEFNNCGKQFPTLHELITHIESVHIDFSPKVFDEIERAKPQCLPMSYVLRYSPDDEPTIKHEIDHGDDVIIHEPIDKNNSIVEEMKKGPDDIVDMMRDNNNNINPASENCAWFSHHHEVVEVKDEDDLYSKHKTKKFSCPVPGCPKRYKNENGMKYHMMNHHDVDGNLIKPKKEFKCPCGKDYKTLRGFQSHMQKHKERPEGELNRTRLGYPPPVYSRMYNPEPHRRFFSNEMMAYPPMDRNFSGLETHEPEFPISIEAMENVSMYNVDNELAKYTIL